MQAVKQCGYVGIGVRDVAMWERFSTEILGLEISGRTADGTLYVRNDGAQHRIALHPDGLDDILYIGWEVADASALQELTHQLRAAGHQVRQGTVEEAARRRVQGVAMTSDPSGIGIELYYGLAQTGHFRSPRGLTFAANNRGFGHIFLNVADFDATQRFYKDTLGMLLSDYIDATLPSGPLYAAFLHCNPRHHSLAFAVRAGTTKKLGHIMLQVDSLDAVGETYDMCALEGIATSTVGRHPNDQMVSFYLKSPSGFQIEYGWGAREIDDANWQPETHQTASIWGHRRDQFVQASRA